MAKAKPKHLGKGLAAKAGKKLKGRKSRIDAELEKAAGKKKKKKRGNS